MFIPVNMGNSRDIPNFLAVANALTGQLHLTPKLELKG
jgi:hypothetical protein